MFGIIGGILLGIVFGIVGLSRTRNSQRRGRAMAIAGIVLSVLWSVALAAVITVVIITSAQRSDTGEVVTGGSESFGNVRVGDCLADMETGEQFGVDVVPCAQPHLAQVFAVFDLPEGPYPGDLLVTEQAESGCLSRIPEQLVDADLQTSYFHPQERGWNGGDRGVICVAVSGTPITGDLPGLSPGA